jgi:hypothetical protein
MIVAEPMFAQANETTKKPREGKQNL